mmetsp:Transcript_11511/g.41004  ORF Transcript_11511/g.41004 Transcript_11511/m.41004 type:complete len:256 (-) Transcript_11511:436-1203(-)
MVRVLIMLLSVPFTLLVHTADEAAHQAYVDAFALPADIATRRLVRLLLEAAQGAIRVAPMRKTSRVEGVPAENGQWRRTPELSELVAARLLLDVVPANGAEGGLCATAAVASLAGRLGAEGEKKPLLRVRQMAALQEERRRIRGRGSRRAAWSSRWREPWAHAPKRPGRRHAMLRHRRPQDASSGHGGPEGRRERGVADRRTPRAAAGRGFAAGELALLRRAAQDAVHAADPRLDGVVGPAVEALHELRRRLGRH